MLQQWNNGKRLQNRVKFWLLIEAAGYVLFNSETGFWLRWRVSSRWGYSDRPTFPDLLIASWPSFRDSVPPYISIFFFLKRFFSSFYYLFRIFFSFSFGFFSSVLRFPAHFGVKVFHLFSTFSPHFHWISVFVVGLCFIWWWKFVLPPSLIDFQLENFLAIEGAFSWVLNYTVFIFLYIYFRRV